MKDGAKKCRCCGKGIASITYGIYRKCVVDAEAVVVRAGPDGEQFIRIDGTKIQAVELPFMPEDVEEGSEMAYRPHRWSCKG